ncbi:Na+/H+ antiporter NhaA [uncultured Methylobacterium sp.]|jgi:NhaA family Na+:H+ antiporter|uniref:Na+/H+ antiporter NhaA n=1 Tax=uncultured Methylobacterium sp. TaxID=157278 RepID=UPI002622C45E|nr:Na+/H+ antiporter NhaA [uncultured Methylobacterium sp.]
MALSPRRAGRALARAHHSPIAAKFLRTVEPFFAGHEVTGGPLLIAAVVALVATNTAFAGAFEAFWDTKLSFGFGERSVGHTLAEWIDHALLPLFFVLIGADVKRELVGGALSRWKTAAFPLAGAVGGMVVPVALFLAVTYGTPEAKGWGTVVAMDTAFGLALIALFSDRLPAGVRALMLAFAAVDDVGGLLVIALAYTETIHVAGLVVAALALAGILGLRRLGVVASLPYVLLAVTVWAGVFESGVHATIAGVMVGLTVPVTPRLDRSTFAEKVQKRIDEFQRAHRTAEETDDEETAMEAQQAAEARLGYIEEMTSATHVTSGRLIDGLTPWVTYLVLPLFALSNVRVHVSSELLGTLTSPLVLGIVAGLALGKPLGFMLFTWAATALGLARRPDRVSWVMVAGIGALAGIGFTISLFIAGLAFEDEVRETASLGVLIASVISAAAGYAVLRRAAASSG